MTTLLTITIIVQFPSFYDPSILNENIFSFRTGASHKSNWETNESLSDVIKKRYAKAGSP